MMRVCNTAIAATGVFLAFATSTGMAQIVPVSSYVYDNAGDLNVIAGKEDGQAIPQALIDTLGRAGEYTPSTVFWDGANGEEGVIYLENDTNIQALQPVPSITFDFGSAQDFQTISVHYGVAVAAAVVAPTGVEVLVDNVSIGTFAGFDPSANASALGDIRVNNIDVGAQNGQLITLLVNGGVSGLPAAGGTSWQGLTEVEFNQQSLLTTLPLNLLVDRENAEIFIENRGDTPVSLKGYSIGSASESIIPTAWTSIASTYDADSGGAVDGDDTWTELTDSMLSSSDELSEYQFGLGDGGVIAPMSTVSLGQGTWVQSILDDLTFEYVDPDTSNIIPASVLYSTDPLRSDLDFDNDIDSDDWNIYVGGLSMDLSSETQIGAYQLGDLDGDLDNDLLDLRIFKSDFDAFNTPGAFEAMIAGQSVPEPTTAWGLACSIAGLALLRRRAKVVAAALAVCCLLFQGTSANAQLLGLYQFDADSRGIALPIGTLNVGDSVADSTGNLASSASVVIGSAEIVPGQAGFGNAAQFTASGVMQALFPSFDQLADDFAISAWLQVTPTPGTANAYYVTNYDDADGGNQLSLIYDFVDENVELFAIGGPQPRPGSEISIADNAWHHVVYTRTGDDFDYYIDGLKTDVSVLSGTIGPVPQTISIGGSTFAGGANFYNGLIDDVAYFDQGLTQSQVDDIRLGDFSEFLPDVLNLRVNSSSGSVSIRNTGSTPIAFDGYQIISDSDSLEFSEWNSLDAQNFDAIGSGDGESWDQGGGSNDGDVSEGFLLGSSTLNPGSSVSLGNLYDETVDARDLFFSFTSAQGTFRGNVTYATGGLEGDFNDDGTVDLADYTVWRNNLGADESVLPAGSGDGSGTVDTGDYLGWKSNFGATSSLVAGEQVPEPSSIVVLMIAGGAFFLCRQSSSKVVFTAIALMLFVQSPSQALELDREYRLGDDPNENGQFGAAVGSQFSPPNEGLSLDSNGSFSGGTAIDISRSFSDGSIDSTNNASYVDVSTRPSGVGTRGVSFDGAGDYLFGPRLGFPESSDAAVIASVPKDYAGIVDRGFQFWAKPSSTGSGNSQAVVMDTNQHGVLISDTDTWVMRTFAGDVDTGVSVNFDSWAHVMHVWTAGVGPRLYVDGIAIGASNVGYNTADNTPLVVGARTDVEGPGTSADFQDFYYGEIDNLELFVAGTSTGGTVYGDFDYTVDNPIAAATLSGIDGDVDQMNGLTIDDLTAFVSGWGSENIVTGFGVGDLTTITQGDLNFDGVTDLRDAVLLDQALINAGLPAAISFGADGAPFVVSTVPEPTAWGSIAVGALLFVGARRRLRGRRLN